MKILPLAYAVSVACCVHSAHAAAPNLVLAIGGEPDTGFDPIMGWGGYGNPLFQSTLLRRDAHLMSVPDLATDWTLSQDRLTWVITLRSDAKFSDGSPLTAEDVAFTFNTAKAASGARDLQVLKSAQAIAPFQVEITLEKPWITFSEEFFTLGIVPKASYGPNYGRKPVGSGPYQLVSWAEGEQLIVEANPYYYGDRSDFNKLTFLFTGEDAGLAAAQAKAVHIVAAPAQMAANVPAGYRAVSLQSVDNRGLSLPFLSPRGSEDKPIGNAVSSDLAIRQALNLGLDRDLIVDVALHGHGTPAYSAADYLPWSNTNDKAPYDLAAAQKILDDGGWQLGADGIRVKDGLRAEFQLYYPASDATRQALAEVSAELLRDLGIDVSPQGASWDEITRVMHSQPVVFGFGSHSPYQIYSLYASNLAGVSWGNPSYYSNAEVDALFNAAQSAPDFESSFASWTKAGDYYGVHGDNAWVWLVNLDHVYFVDECLDLGQTQIEPHGHGWPITSLISNWTWKCN